MTTYTRWRGRLASRRVLAATAQRRVSYWRKRLTKAKPHTVDYNHAAAMLSQRLTESRKRRLQVRIAVRAVARHKPKPQPTLRERAYREAVRCIGVMETGGNNSGPEVAKFIRANGGSGPEAWCGDFQAWCYRSAGSKAVQRLWASVYYLGRIAGLHRVTTPERGDLVRFTFDHVGMFVRDRGDGTIETIEGNTGSSGAVSDSKTGGDGVYRKVRVKSLVNDYLRVER